MFVEIRLIPGLGGSITGEKLTVRTSMAYDTGSNRFTISPEHLDTLGYDSESYGGNKGVEEQTTASGTIRDCAALLIEMRVYDEDYQKNKKVSPWFREHAQICDMGPLPALSGDNIRKVLYLATAPGAKPTLYVAERKKALVDMLPEL